MSGTNRTDTNVSDASNAGKRQQVPVAGGTLVFESRALGKELVGFVDVEDWDELADAIAARGLSRGAVYNLPELDDVEGAV